MAGPGLGETYLLARSHLMPDEVFGDIASLTRAICRARDQLAGAPALLFRTAEVWRGDQMHGGAAVAVRAHDGAESGHGTLVAYAFLPGSRAPAQRLCEAVRALAAPKAPA